MTKITREQFALWSFERDRSVGLYSRAQTWQNLPKDEKDDYLEEADYYMKLSRCDWPEDILERL